MIGLAVEKVVVSHVLLIGSNPAGKSTEIACINDQTCERTKKPVHLQPDGPGFDFPDKGNFIHKLISWRSSGSAFCTGRPTSYGVN